MTPAGKGKKTAAREELPASEPVAAAVPSGENERFLAAIAAIADGAFARLWDNPLDAGYDQL